MTGFARAEGRDDSLHWIWELKSVNGRTLDLRCRLPAGMDGLEPIARAAVAERLRRGNVSVSLTLMRGAKPPKVRINREVLAQLLIVVKELQGQVEAAAPRLDGLLGVRGVVDVIEEEEEDEAVRQARQERIAATLTEALDALRRMRAAEGARLAAIVGGHLDEIEKLRGAAAATAAVQPAALRERLRSQVAALLESVPALPEERLAQEAALIIAKGDVREELDRLAAHVAAARDLMAEEGAVGRKLDFLCQEFNREANTLCSKSTDVELTRIGLALKAAIEQLREQIQNIE
jgi:uncharacterized protein (TIGR00255 family)